MFRRYKSGGDEPGKKDEIVIKVDPIVPKAPPAKPAKQAPGKPTPAGKSGKPSTSIPSGKSAGTGKSSPAAKSSASAKSSAPAKSAPARSDAKPGKATSASKSAAAAKSAKPAPAAKSNASKSAKSSQATEPVEEAKPRKRGLGSRLAGLLARPEPELDYEEDPMEDLKDAIKDARSKAELEAELQRQAEEFGLAASDPISLYGPNGEEVAALIDSLADIDDELAEEIADSYELTPEAERKVAQSVIRRRHRGGKLSFELETAERAIADWFSGLGLAEDDDIALYSVVVDAALDAVDALVLVDDLADEDFNTLYEPWADAMDADEDEDEEEGEEAAEAEAEAAEEEEDEDAAEEGQFGPNTTLVTELLTKLGTLDSEPVVELIEVWREQPKEELRLAHHSLQALADESSKWREQMRLAQEEVFSWMEGGATRFNKARGNVGDWVRTREIAGPAVADAVAALVMADMLDSEDATVLYDPWAKVIGEPQLPVYEDEGEDEDDEGEGEEGGSEA